MRILIVDDDPAIREMLADHLRRHGHDIRDASGVREAIDCVRASPPDIVISDVEMGDGTAVELVDDIRESVNGPPVILVTGGAGDVARTLLDEGRVWAVLAKPFALPFLTALVDTLSARGPDSAPGDSSPATLSGACGLGGKSSAPEPRRASRAGGCV